MDFARELRIRGTEPERLDDWDTRHYYWSASPFWYTKEGRLKKVVCAVLDRYRLRRLLLQEGVDLARDVTVSSAQWCLDRGEDMFYYSQGFLKITGVEFVGNRRYHVFCEGKDIPFVCGGQKVIFLGPKALDTTP